MFYFNLVKNKRLYVDDQLMRRNLMIKLNEEQQRGMGGVRQSCPRGRTESIGDIVD